MAQTAPANAHATQPEPTPALPQAQVRIVLPPKPKLAPGVKLAGQMLESAFANPPWLIEREELGYVHATPLLYRVAELCTGENTYEDIAHKLEESGTPVRTDTVQRLVLQLLIPRGLVENGDGAVFQPKALGALSRINIRTKEIPPHVIAPVANVLRWLYWPPVAIVILLAAGLVEGWIYFVHGIAGGLRDAIYSPALMLLLLLFVIFAAGFHELGHAAALHYAGEQVKGMGAGLYLVYPAFYTDVTNNYRLRRWPRLRTDLGGFYFNLIFSLGVMGAYVITGQEWLLLVVLLINFEIIHQLLPFLRLDGYWALADITGVPDFLSQMGAFVRAVVPGLKPIPGKKMPELKWWAKAIFASYIIISIPLMAVLIFVMVRAAPRAFATAWDSFAHQSGVFGQAQTKGEVLGMVTSAGQMFLLALPTLGLAYTLFLLAKRLFMFIWRWSQPSLPRRIAGGFSTAAIVGVLVWMWAPALPSSGHRKPVPGPAYAAASTNFVPIARQDHGTVQEALAPLPPIGVPDNVPPNGRDTAGRPGASAGGGATGTATNRARTSASGSASPSASASAPADASAEASASASAQSSAGSLPLPAESAVPIAQPAGGSGSFASPASSYVTGTRSGATSSLGTSQTGNAAGGSMTSPAASASSGPTPSGSPAGATASASGSPAAASPAGASATPSPSLTPTPTAAP